ncbi:MAG: hypothetical protein C4576_11745 [Desulfobacteraceae bacterium]|nr:MAG: hypothetical protein C4576_11745 [Desulfobacteraceae bacterium]
MRYRKYRTAEYRISKKEDMEAFQILGFFSCPQIFPALDADLRYSIFSSLISKFDIRCSIFDILPFLASIFRVR